MIVLKKCEIIRGISMHSKINTTLFFMPIVLLLACSMERAREDDYKYGKGFNGVKAHLGIPPIEDKWINHEQTSDSSFFWMHWSRKLIDNKAHHFCKATNLKDGRLLEEEDAFHFEYKEDSSFRLIMNVVFKSDSIIYKSSYELIIYHTDLYPPTSSKMLTQNQADSVLKEWRLDYRMPIK